MTSLHLMCPFCWRGRILAERQPDGSTEFTCHACCRTVGTAPSPRVQQMRDEMKPVAEMTPEEREAFFGKRRLGRPCKIPPVPQGGQGDARMALVREA